MKKSKLTIMLVAVLLVVSILGACALTGCEEVCTAHVDANKDLKCDNCGVALDCDHSDASVIPAVPATCTEPGLTEGKKCNVCGEVLVAQTEVPAVGHINSDADNKCDNCDKTFVYTLHDSMGAGPTNWNPHVWETNADNYFAGYTEMGLVDVTIADDGVNYAWVWEMATGIEDVTAEYQADEEKNAKWEVGELTEGKVYRIYLNELAKWADGTPINADTYVYSMKQLLNPKMQNYRANTYYAGQSAIKNAAKYFNSESPIYDYVYAEDAEGNEIPFDFENNAVYLHLTKPWMLNSSYAIYDLMDMGYIDAAEYNALAEEANPYGFVELTADNAATVKSVIAQFLTAFGINLTEENAIDNIYARTHMYYNTGKFSEPFAWENVGLVKVDDYTIDYIHEGAESEYYFLVSLTSNWIVYEDLYEAGKTQLGDLITTDYGTAVDKYMSYGPYKLDSYELDKQMRMSRNENWYGWTDGLHVGQYMTTNIVCDIISDEATLEGLFLTGKVDGLGLNATQLAEYRNSQYLLKTDQTYTFRFVFASDLSKLTALETQYNNGANLKVLSYDDFRKAISLAIDRAKMCAQGTGGYKPAYALFNRLYYYDVENDPSSIYRDTAEAKQVILDIYGVKYGEDEAYKTLDEAYNSITGFDLAQAKELFQSVYETAIADGNYTEGQKVIIHCMATGADTLSEDDSAQERLLNEFVAAATVDTGFEGLISFEFSAGAADRYGDVAAGRIEMIRGAWGGAAFFPFSTIRCYTEPEYMGGLSAIHESCGWDPSKEELTLVYDFDLDPATPDEEITLTLDKWAMSINDGYLDEASGDLYLYTDGDTKMMILAELEQAVLESYQCIPFASETACSLFSQKIKYATLEYNIMYGYGGLRLMTYNYDDVAWEEYVASQGGELKY
ncbi:MAG: hypothetical protein IJX70_03325 [Clostridia bacterium]|nr:hypothetical protein [Clostridia bacterium]